MTQEEKKLIQNSARLCGQRNRLLAQIEAEKKKRKPVPIVQKRVANEADKYVEEKSKHTIPPLSRVVKACFPAVLCFLGCLIPDGFIMLLCMIAGGVLFYWFYFTILF